MSQDITSPIVCVTYLLFEAIGKGSGYTRLVREWELDR